MLFDVKSICRNSNIYIFFLICKCSVLIKYILENGRALKFQWRTFNLSALLRDTKLDWFFSIFRSTQRKMYRLKEPCPSVSRSEQCCVHTYVWSKCNDARYRGTRVWETLHISFWRTIEFQQQANRRSDRIVISYEVYTRMYILYATRGGQNWRGSVKGCATDRIGWTAGCD